MDGCSTDDTVKIIQSYSVKNKSVKCISEKDQGVYDAMNKGVKMAKGEWVYFLGSDDTLFDQHVLEKVNDHLKTVNCSVLYGNISSPVYGEKYDGEFNAQKILSKNIAHQAIFYKRKIFKVIGYYNLNYAMLADWDFNLRWMNNRKIKGEYIDLIIANYAPGGISDNNYDSVFHKDFPF